VVSDATGSTAESVLTSVRVQFPNTVMRIRRFPFIRSTEQIDKVLDIAPERECVVIYTIVSDEIREYLVTEGRKKGLTMIDVMGRLLHLFSRVLHRPPESEPGMLVHDKSEELIRLGEAIRYTMRHDDGMCPDDWGEADLLILGPSRTGKTPTSVFLSCKRLKVANIPIVPSVDPPKGLARLRVRMVGFVMAPERLRAIRESRAFNMTPTGTVRGYASEKKILDELAFCEDYYKRVPGLKVVDVTDRSIEETAEWIGRHVL
jgi:regulator of PEP synthase PpsR (kinase-PPPase family)